MRIGGGRRSLNGLSGGLRKPDRTLVLNVTPDLYAYRVYNYTGDVLPAISPFSDLFVTTDATTMDVVCRSTMDSGSVALATIGIFVNGVINQYITFTTAELNTTVTRSITLPAGNKEVTFRLGSSYTGATGDIIRGQYVSKITVTSGTRVVPIQKARKAKRAIFITDSIGVGFITTSPPIKAFIPLMRADSRVSDWEIASFGWGSNAAIVMLADTTKVNDAVANIIAYTSGATEKVVYMQLGTNDYGISKPTTTAYAARIAAFYDALNLADPTIRIVSVTAFPRAVETVNSSGFTLQQYRNALSGLSTSRAYVKNIDGPTILAVDETAVDNLHYTDFGNQKMQECFVRDLLGIPQMLPVAPDIQYMVASAAATGFVTVPTSASISLVTKPAFTVTFISKRTRINAADAVIGQGAATGSFYAGFINTNVMRIGANGNANGYFDLTLDTIPVKVGGWHHWAISKVGLAYEVWVDGLLVASVTKTVNISVAGNITIGAWATQYGVINLDRLRVYNKKLSQSEILADKYLLALTDFTNVAAEYLMNGNANDTSPNLNNGNVGSTVTFPAA